jgi:hypothetical protein
MPGGFEPSSFGGVSFPPSSSSTLSVASISSSHSTYHDFYTDVYSSLSPLIFLLILYSDGFKSLCYIFRGIVLQVVKGGERNEIKKSTSNKKLNIKIHPVETKMEIKTDVLKREEKTNQQMDNTNNVSTRNTMNKNNSSNQLVFDPQYPSSLFFGVLSSQPYSLPSFTTNSLVGVSSDPCSSAKRLLSKSPHVVSTTNPTNTEPEKNSPHLFLALPTASSLLGASFVELMHTLFVFIPVESFENQNEIKSQKENLSVKKPPSFYSQTLYQILFDFIFEPVFCYWLYLIDYFRYFSHSNTFSSSDTFLTTTTTLSRSPTTPIHTPKSNRKRDKPKPHLISPTVPTRLMATSLKLSEHSPHSLLIESGLTNQNNVLFPFSSTDLIPSKCLALTIPNMCFLCPIHLNLLLSSSFLCVKLLSFWHLSLLPLDSSSSSFAKEIKENLDEPKSTDISDSIFHSFNYLTFIPHSVIAASFCDLITIIEQSLLLLTDSSPKASQLISSQLISSSSSSSSPSSTLFSSSSSSSFINVCLPKSLRCLLDCYLSMYSNTSNTNIASKTNSLSFNSFKSFSSPFVFIHLYGFFFYPSFGLLTPSHTPAKFLSPIPLLSNSTLDHFLNVFLSYSVASLHCFSPVIPSSAFSSSSSSVPIDVQKIFISNILSYQYVTGSLLFCISYLISFFSSSSPFINLSFYSPISTTINLPLLSLSPLLSSSSNVLSLPVPSHDIILSNQTLLHRLCNFPLEFYTDPGLKRLLISCIILIVFEGDKNNIISKEILNSQKKEDEIVLSDAAKILVSETSISRLITFLEDELKGFNPDVGINSSQTAKSSTISSLISTSSSSVPSVWKHMDIFHLLDFNKLKYEKLLDFLKEG